MMIRWPRSARQVAGLAITAEFLALIRTLGEVFRTRYFDPEHYTLAAMEPFVGAALFTAILVAAAVTMFTLGRYRAALTIATANIAALFVYRITMM